MSRLPGILAEIADVAGEEAALAIARARGGVQIYVPPCPAEDHWLSLLLGHAAAQKVCDQLTAGVGPRRVDVPQGPAGRLATIRASDQAVIDAMIRDQRSERDIALSTGYTERSVRRRRAKLGKPADTRQISFL
jgi:hypothetical protein